jgi:hypothetical protein
MLMFVFTNVFFCIISNNFVYLVKKIDLENEKIKKLKNFSRKNKLKNEKTF